MTTRQGKPGQKLGSRRSVGVLAILLALILLADLLATRGPGLAGAASITPQASPTPVRPLATLPPSATARPATRVAARPTQIQGTPSSTATATPSLTASPEPTVTATPTATATATPTPSPPAPTASATWTSTPALSPSPASSPSPVATTELTEEILTILLIGGDRDYVLDMNTDTLIVAVVNRGTKQVSLLSIPRDLWVYIPTYDWARINVAHRLGARGKYPEGGGPGLLMRTIEENLGISIDHWVRIGYEGFSRAVDELGGVDMVVPCTVNLRYQPPDSVDEQEMILAAGLHHLDGATALRYVRTRRGDSDFERAQRQQQFIKSVWYQFKSPATVLKIPALWTAMQGAFATDLQLGDVLALAPVGLELEPQRVRSLSIGRGQVENWTTPEGSSVLLPIPERIQEVVARLYAPGAAAPAATEAARIQVQNGTGRAQLALIAADRLRWEGLEVVDTGPADRADYARTQIIVFNEKPEALAALTRLLKVRPENVTWQPDAGQAADLRVILGTDYDPCP